MRLRFPTEACIVALFVSAIGAFCGSLWAWQVREQGPNYGQDSAVYTMIAAQRAAGAEEVLWNALLGPALPFALSLPIEAGVSFSTAYRTIALFGYLGLVAATGFFGFRLASRMAVTRGWALASGGMLAVLFASQPDVSYLSVQPLTDPLSLAAVLAAMGLLIGRSTSLWTSAAMGALLSIAYLTRFSLLSVVLLVVAGAVGSMIGSVLRRETPRRRAIAHAILVLGIPSLTVTGLFARLSVTGFEGSYGANTQIVAQAALSKRAHGVREAIYGLHADGTVGLCKIDPALPDSWNYYHWLGTCLDDRDESMGSRVALVPRRLGMVLVKWVQALRVTAANNSGSALLLGALAWAYFLLRSRGWTEVVLWVPPLAGLGILAGGTLIFFHETRYSWLPAVVCLSAVPVAMARSFETLSMSRGRRRTGCLGVTVLYAAVSVLWGWNVLVGSENHPGTVAQLASHRSAAERRVFEGVRDLLEPVASRSAIEMAKGRLPFSGVTVASHAASHAFAVGARWFPMPHPILAEFTQETGVTSTQAVLNATLAALRRANAEYVVLRMLWKGEPASDPALSPLFGPAEGLPAGVEIVGDVRLRAHGPTAVRVLRVLPNPSS